MIAHKYINRIVAAVMALAVCLCFCAMGFVSDSSGGLSMEYETALFDTAQPISVNIIMDESEWEEMLDEAMSEQYYQCDVEVNGQTFHNVGIRPKGNTSLTSIANDPDTDRFSLKLEFDRYVDGQICFGLDKLILNNNYADATNMKEALIYDMYQYLGADASLYNYAKVNVNGEYWGVYLALEAVEDSFLLRNYGVQSGELYKPDSMEFGGGGKSAPDGMEPPSFNDGEFPSPPDFTQNGPGTDMQAEFPETGTTSDSAIEQNGAGRESGFPNNSPDMGTETNGNASNRGGFPGGGPGGFGMGSNGANLNYSDDDLDSYSTIWDGAVTDSSKADHKRVVTALKHASEGTELETYMDIDNLLKYMAVHVFSVNEDSLSGMMAHNYYLYENNGQLNIIPWDYNLALGGMGGMGGDASSMINDAIDTPFSGTKFFDKLLENEGYREQYHAYLSQLVEQYINGSGFDEFYSRTCSQIDSLAASDPTAFYTETEYTAAKEMLYETVHLRGKSIEGQLAGTIPSTDEAQDAEPSKLLDAAAIDLETMGKMSMGGPGGHVPERGGNTGTEPSATPVFNDGAPAVIDPSQADTTVQRENHAAELANGMPDDFDLAQMNHTDSSSANHNLILSGICLAAFLAVLIFTALYKRKSIRL